MFMLLPYLLTLFMFTRTLSPQRETVVVWVSLSKVGRIRDDPSRTNGEVQFFAWAFLVLPMDEFNIKVN